MLSIVTGSTGHCTCRLAVTLTLAVLMIVAREDAACCTLSAWEKFNNVYNMISAWYILLSHHHKAKINPTSSFPKM